MGVAQVGPGLAAFHFEVHSNTPWSASKPILKCPAAAGVGPGGANQHKPLLFFALRMTKLPSQFMHDAVMTLILFVFSGICILVGSLCSCGAYFLRL